MPVEIVAGRRKAAQEGGNGIAIPLPPLEAFRSAVGAPMPLAEWMHRHFAEKVVAGSELLAELDDGDGTTVSA